MARGNPKAKPPTKTKDITLDKLDKMVQAYMVNGFNKTQAVAAAGYSKHTAQAKCNELFKHPYVIQKLKEIKEETRKEFKVTHEQILKELFKIGFSDIGNFLEDGNEITDVKKLKPEKRKVVEMIKKTVTEFEGGTKTSVQIKLHSKIAALEAIAKHTGFYNEDNKQKKTIIKVGFTE